ncbi:MAG TPA: hypothetical protein H9983_05020 [Candidatus Kurthia intestinigallinarum]|nr:hypothetical protein [Candidatus Kurthia intestinigallinarum]
MKKLLIIVVSCLSLLIAGTVELTSVRAKSPSTMTELKASVEKHLIDLDKTFTIKYIGNGDDFVKYVNQLIPNAIAKKPEIDSVVKSYTATSYRSKNGGEATFNVKYYTSKAKQAKALDKIKRVAKKIKKKYPNSPYKQVKNVHNYVIGQTKYDSREADRYSIYGVMYDGRAVCQGYAMTTYYLLKELDIDVRYVTGFAGGENHAWNKVKLNGKWYNLDTTWDDSAASKYHYFLISDAKLAKNHQWNTRAFPKALKTYAAK